MDVYMCIISIIPEEMANIIMKHICIQNVKNMLKYYEIDPLLFFEELQKNNCVLIGSSILHCYLNELQLILVDQDDDPDVIDVSPKINILSCKKQFMFTNNWISDKFGADEFSRIYYDDSYHIKNINTIVTYFKYNEKTNNKKSK